MKARSSSQKSTNSYNKNYDRNAESSAMEPPSPVVLKRGESSSSMASVGTSSRRSLRDDDSERSTSEREDTIGTLPRLAESSSADAIGRKYAGYQDNNIADAAPKHRNSHPARRPVFRKGEGNNSRMQNNNRNNNNAASMSNAEEMFRAVEATLEPPAPRPRFGRTESTQVRLSRQGYGALQKEKSLHFVVQAIRRGTPDWQSRMEPFVADLVFRSLVKSRYYSEPTFRPYVCHAAVLFVDLSGYSKITAALAHRGAHAISEVVNDYLDKLLRIIHSIGGDVVKFAGDAVLVVWEGTAEKLKTNVMAAAWCALELQAKEGVHPVEIEGQQTNLAFRIHCGLACGVLESEVFEAPTHVNMQRLYHSVGGKPVDEIGELVDLAASGEVCISEECVDLLKDCGAFRDVSPQITKPKILSELNLDAASKRELDEHTRTIIADRDLRRESKIEEEFIHPTVLRLLSHGGNSPTQIAQMRNLCVLFIAMVANGSALNWLLEVQRILDRNRCPIVQIIDDDKGVHLVAAINLYDAIPECAFLGIQVCKELLEREVGCAIGMAMGSTFCGVTGSSSIACRWDITGPPAVRAARLMQYAIKNEIGVVIDDSIFQDPIASSRLTVLHKGVRIKGTAEPQRIYTLSPTDHGTAAFRILENEQTTSVHEGKIQEIQQILCAAGSRSKVAIITGPPMSGKKFAAQIAAGREGMTPFLHVSSESAGYLQLANTIATWFQHVDDSDMRAGAEDVLNHLKAERWSRAHDACIELMSLAVVLDMKACFVVDRVHFLDEFSTSLIRETLRGRRTKGGRELLYHWSGLVSNVSEHDSDVESATIGRICFLCVHVSLYEWPSAQEVKARITRSESKYDLPVITIGKVSRGDLGRMFREIEDMEAHERWLKIYGESSGYCAGYFVERVAASRFISEQLRLQGEKGHAMTNEDLMLQVPTGMMKRNRDLTVHQISADIAMKFTQVFDGLPPLFQQFLKVLTVATKSSFSLLLKQTVWEVLNDLIAEGVDKNVFGVVVREMEEMFLIEVGANDRGEETVTLSSPALADVTFDVATPEQIDSISMALLDRLQPLQDKDYRIPFIMACLHYRLDKTQALTVYLFKKGYKMLLGMRNEISEASMNWMKEALDEEIASCGYHTRAVLGEDFQYETLTEKNIESDLLLVKFYTAPLSFGPMAQTLTVITRNIFHEVKNFRNSTDDERVELLSSFASACGRYCNEVLIVETFLESFGLRVDNKDLDDELQKIMYISEPAQTFKELRAKAYGVLNDLVPKSFESRRKRLLTMVGRLRTSTTAPWPVTSAQPAVKQAYDALMATKSQNDGVHEALMKLAVNQWKPKKVPEHLPFSHRQTLANIRNTILQRSSNDAQLYFSRHQQGPDDLVAFFVIAPLLYQNPELNHWYTS